MQQEGLIPSHQCPWSPPEPSPAQGGCGQSPGMCHTAAGGICPLGRGFEGGDGAPYQVPHAQHVLKLLRHGVVLHGHEESVEHDADGDAQVHKGVHHHQLDKLLQLHPGMAAIPDQECVGEFVPPGWAFLVSFFQL